MPATEIDFPNLALGRSAFSPRAFGDALAGWWDASDPATLTLNGARVSAWADKSGRGRTAFQSSTTQMPTFQAAGRNARPSLRFDTTQYQHLRLFGAEGLPAGQGASTVVAQAFINPTSSYYYAVDWGDPSGSYRRVGSGGGKAAALSGQFQQAADSFSGEDRAVVWSVTGGGAPVSTLYIDGGPGQMTALAPATTAATQGAIGAAAYGANAYGSFWPGDVQEVVILNRAVTAAEADLLAGYLAWKWNRQDRLPADHPWRRAAP